MQPLGADAGYGGFLQPEAAQAEAYGAEAFGT